MSKVYLSIGSNKGNRSVLINKAIDEIENNIGIIISRSGIYQSKSWGFDSNDFYNLCLLIETDIEPESLTLDMKEALDIYMTHKDDYFTDKVVQLKPWQESLLDGKTNGC